jgi:hypothetical protein
LHPDSLVHCSLSLFLLENQEESFSFLVNQHLDLQQNHEEQLVQSMNERKTNIKKHKHNSVTNNTDLRNFASKLDI